ncbi:unnamed protein product [Oikopleura dioica]|uniref:Uncharacterized protein n=2 Tax=Oikopleura dioica TaxID=34765 RepID=E4YI03_OIKDI|nr:unnamed protein product [Oikopleura dioica]
MSILQNRKKTVFPQRLQSKLHLNIKMKLLAGVLASWVSAQYSNFYDYDQTYYGKSQVAQSEGYSPEVASVARTLGNGRICWSCLEETYTKCLLDDFSATTMRGDEKRHGAVYCQGEDYFCYISERRIIRHSENEWNYENGNPWQATNPIDVDHAELINGLAGADPSTEVRVQMGCQQPLSCLRQQWQNYQIQMGKSFQQGTVALVDGAYVPVGSQTEVRSGLCRHHNAWVDHASGLHTVNDQWRKHSWMGDTSQPGNGKVQDQGWGDRRFGAIERHFQRGKATESVCHHCCDPYLEYNAKGCNNVAATAYAVAAVDRVDETAEATDEANIFLLRPASETSLDWSSASGKPQYHGAFRNPHTQREKEVLGTT